MPQGNHPTVDVQALVIYTQHLSGLDHRRGECLVNFEKINVRGSQLLLLQQLLGRIDAARHHLVGLATGGGTGHQARHRGTAELVGEAFITQQHQRRRVAHGRRITRRVHMGNRPQFRKPRQLDPIRSGRAKVGKGGRQPSQFFRGQFGSRAFVHGHLAGGGPYGHNRGKTALLNGPGSPLLACQGHPITVLPAGTNAGGDQVGTTAHQ